MQNSTEFSALLQLRPLRFLIFSYMTLEDLRKFIVLSKDMLFYFRDYVKDAKNLRIKQRDFSLMTTGKKFRPFFSTFSNITSLELNCRKLELSFVSCLPRHLKSLKLTKLKHRHIANPQFYADLANRLGNSLEVLKLDLRCKYDHNSYPVDEDLLKGIRIMFLTLKKLKSFAFTTGVYGNFVKRYVMELYLTILKTGQSLETLKITNFAFIHLNEYNGLSLPKLKDLTFINDAEELSTTTWLISQNFFLHVVIHFPNLTTLRICEQSANSNLVLHESTIINLASAYPQLERLELGYRGSSVTMPRLSLLTAFNLLPMLREVSFSSCKTLDSTIIKELVAKHRLLETINFDYTLCDDDALDAIVEVYGKRNILKKVSLKSCSHITEEGFKDFFAGLEGLERVNISKNYNVTGEVIQALVVASPDLKQLIISHSGNIENGILSLVLTGLERLEKLTFSHMYESEGSVITPDCFEELGERRFERLRSLNFSYHDYIDESTVFRIVTKFPGLEKLKLNGCEKLTKAAIEILEKGGFCARLKVLGLQAIPNILFKDKEDINRSFKAFTKLLHLEVDSIFY